MGDFINNNSALLLLIACAGTVLLLGWDRRRSKRALAIIAVVTLVLAAGYMQARIEASDIESVASLDATLDGGTPVVMEVFSNT
jgi:CHASE2 domain-containing sensor protein